ncbi:MAG: hypothetical protein ABI140_18380 [Jatrophihabitantaceae bacterium]
MTASTRNAIEVPNFYTLAGRGIAITIAMSGIDGKPQVTYHDSRQAVSFHGPDEVDVLDSPLGTLVSITTVRSVDLGSTSFTVILPAINLAGGGSHQLETIGIITLHRTTIAGLGHSQLSTSHTVRLRGAASQVQP